MSAVSELYPQKGKTCNDCCTFIAIVTPFTTVYADNESVYMGSTLSWLSISRALRTSMLNGIP